MAKDVVTKKRKASVPEQDATKMKKPKKLATEVPVVPGKKRKATEDAAPIDVKKPKTPKSTGEITSKPAKEPTSQKGSEKTNREPVKKKEIKAAAKKTNGIKESVIAAKKTKELKLPKPVDEEEDDGAMADEENETSDVDDQTEALLKGFESDNDEEQDNKEGGIEEGQDVPEIPALSNKTKKALLRAQNEKYSDKPGVVYVGRIPHGFYENEMREYFKQFGNILKLRLSRNPKNGASRHYAFIQFESAGVAVIVAKTMDGYLMFNHILKVKVVPDEQVHDDLFKGANKRFKKVPWNKIRGRELDLGASEATWDKRIEKEGKRREAKAEKMKEIGYEFQAPKIKSAKNVAKKPIEQLALTENGEDESEAVEAPPAVQEVTKSKKKGKKGKAVGTAADPVKEIEAAPVAAPVVEASEKPKKKEKKAKEAKVIETAAPASVVEEPSKPKVKKEKKSKTVESTEAPVSDGPEKKPKTKKSKSALVDEPAVDGEGGEKKKSKKAKKVKADA